MRTVLRLLAVLIAVTLPAGSALALVYTSGDVLYVAYQSPSGPNYIVDLGSRTQFVNATTTLTFTDVMASDLNGVIGATAPSIWVGLFGVLNPSPGTNDGILVTNGPLNDFDLSIANVVGAVSQVNSFGGNVAGFSLAVPSGNPRAGKFVSSGSFGSYQSTLNGVNKGSLGNNLDWDIETALSNSSGQRNSATVRIPLWSAIRNPFTGVSSRRLLGFFSLNPDGSLTYSPDADGDSIPDDIDLCPGISDPDNSDVDGDHHAPACDCNPTDGTTWSLPTEVPSFSFTGAAAYSWTAPSNPGGTTPLYDVLRGLRSTPGSPSLACFQGNLAGLSNSDTTIPAVGQAFYYLSRAGNSCGEGVAGTASNGQPIAAPACP